MVFGARGLLRLIPLQISGLVFWPVASPSHTNIPNLFLPNPCNFCLGFLFNGFNLPTHLQPKFQLELDEK